jgi:hypothetical protein
MIASQPTTRRDMLGIKQAGFAMLYHMHFPEIAEFRSLSEHGTHLLDLMALLDEMLTS